MKDFTTKSKIGKGWIRGGVVAALWLLLWQAAARVVGQELLLVSPLTVLRRLLQLVGQPVFWQAVLSSCGRIMSGVLLALAAGTVLAALMSRFSFLYAFFRPALQVIKATPVASFIILALVWIRSGALGAFAAFLMVLPMAWANLYEGLGAVDKELLEMAKAYELSPGKKLRYLYLPSLLPYFAAACSAGIGIGWKAGVAAEVLGLPQNSIGKALYNAKIYLEMPDLFCWTAVIILLSLFFEKLAAYLLRAVTARLARGGKPDDSH
ncbi:MAG: ABC transporter permease subunit [Oscillospiraceae bacterium]|nr:ABC transporter permease subunit [Oscillospiraceae bacterium]